MKSESEKDKTSDLCLGSKRKLSDVDSISLQIDSSTVTKSQKIETDQHPESKDVIGENMVQTLLGELNRQSIISNNNTKAYQK